MDDLNPEKLLKEIDQLRALNRKKDERLSQLGHEMKNALNTIVGLADLLKSGDLEGGEIQQAAEIIHRNGSNIQQLVNNLLDSDKIEKGEIEFKTEPVEINNFMQKLEKDYKFLANRKNISLNFKLLPASLVIYAYRIKLWQIMGNLISNAIKFTPEGGNIFVSVEYFKNSTDGEPTVLFEVSDNGIGIPDEFMPKLFNKFGMHHRPGTNREQGIGIGLSVVKNLVELHSGKIDVETQVGKGTTFTITLPVKQESEALGKTEAS